MGILGFLNSGVANVIGTIVATAANFIISALLSLINGIITNPAFQQTFTSATTGNLSDLCSGKIQMTDCGGPQLAESMAPYAEFLALCCWGYAVLKSIDDMTQAELLKLLFLVRRGLVTLAAVWFTYPIARMLWEICRVASNAMVYDINCGNMGAATGGSCSQFAINLPHNFDLLGGFGAAWENLAYGVLVLIEIAFLVVWMMGSTIGALIGSIFGAFAVAVGGSTMGKYVKFMSSIYLMRLMLPPAAAVITRVMNNYGASTATGGFFQGLSVIFLMFGLLWVTGKVIGFVGEGIVAGAGTVTGLFDTGKRHGQSAYNMMASPAGWYGLNRAGTMAYRGFQRQKRSDEHLENIWGRSRHDRREHGAAYELGLLGQAPSRTGYDLYWPGRGYGHGYSSRSTTPGPPTPPPTPPPEQLATGGNPPQPSLGATPSGSGGTGSGGGTGPAPGGLGWQPRYVFTGQRGPGERFAFLRQNMPQAQRDAGGRPSIERLLAGNGPANSMREQVARRVVMHLRQMRW